MKKRKWIKLSTIFFIVFLTLNMLIVTVYGLRDKDAKTDVAVILGNEVYTDGTLSNRLKARVDEGDRLYKDKKVKYLIVTGGIDSNGMDEAYYMKKYLENKGIPAKDIIEDNYGNTTYKSAVNLRKIMEIYKFHSVTIVSQYFHIMRSEFLLKSLGIKDIKHSYAKNFFELKDIYSIFREVVAIYYWFFKLKVFS